MAALNIEDIEQDATNKLTLAKKTKELQILVDRVYPGYKVVLSQDGAENGAAMKEQPSEFRTRTRNVFGDLTQTQQIGELLKDGPVQLDKLFFELQSRGSGVSKQSLMSLLSAGKKSGKFRKHGRGVWGLMP